ncbi:MAG: hypothetical protein V4850_30580 [Myxococcota bacterium]
MSRPGANPLLDAAERALRELRSAPSGSAARTEGDRALAEVAKQGEPERAEDHAAELVVAVWLARARLLVPNPLAARGLDFLANGGGAELYFEVKHDRDDADQRLLGAPAGLRALVEARYGPRAVVHVEWPDGPYPPGEAWGELSRSPRLPSAVREALAGAPDLPPPQGSVLLSVSVPRRAEDQLPALAFRLRIARASLFSVHVLDPADGWGALADRALGHARKKAEKADTRGLPFALVYVGIPGERRHALPERVGPAWQELSGIAPAALMGLVVLEPKVDGGLRAVGAFRDGWPTTFGRGLAEDPKAAPSVTVAEAWARLAGELRGERLRAAAAAADPEHERELAELAEAAQRTGPLASGALAIWQRAAVLASTLGVKVDPLHCWRAYPPTPADADTILAPIAPRRPRRRAG